MKTVSGLSYTDKNAVTNGKKYQYKIVAYDKTSESIASSVKTIYRLSPTKPSSVKSKSSGKLSVSRSKNKSASGYQIRYSKSKNFSSCTTKSVSSSKTSATYSGLSKGKTYYVRVKAYKKDSTDSKVYGKVSKTIKVKIMK